MKRADALTLSEANRVPEGIERPVHDELGLQRTSATAAMAGFFFSFRAVLVLITARWLHLGTETGVIANLIVEAILLMTVIFQAMGPSARPATWMMRAPSFRWVLFFLGFSSCSLLWSATVSPFGSFLYWCGLAADVSVVVLLMHAKPVAEVSHSMMRGFIRSTCILAAIAWIMPTQQDLRLGDEDYFNTNQIGNLCAMAIFMAQFLAGRRDGRWRASLLFLIVTLLRTLSKATLVAFAVSQLFLLIRDDVMSRKQKAKVAIGTMIVILAFWGLIGSYYSYYTTTGNQAETLTGRITIWAYTLNTAMEKPWIGNGIDAMWKVFPPFGKELFEARHAENELLQQFFAYGAVGIAMLAGLYGSLYRRICGMWKGSSKVILTAIMLFIVVRGLFEAEPFDLLLPLWMITLISAIVEQGREPSREEGDWSPVIPARAPLAGTAST